ncbi:hypothetical protein AD998_11355 [bacterium 336/3]|nr:hypothetical protein AD998_11355 [bacterium 336/3]
MATINLISATLLITLFISNSIFAQKYSMISEQKQEVPISIFSNFIFQGIYPGFRMGIEQPLKHTTFSDKRGNFLKYKEQSVQYSIGFYYHGGFHTNFFATSEYVFRRISKNGFITEFKTGLSLSRTFLGATTYEVNGNGSVHKINGVGDFYFMPSLNFGIGKDFGIKKPSFPLILTVNTNLAGLLPYNGLILPTPMLEIGLRYKFKKGFTVKSKNISKQHKSK